MGEEDRRLFDTINQIVGKLESEETGSSYTQVGSIYTGPIPNDTCPLRTHTGLSRTLADPCPAEAGPSRIEADPCSIQAGPSLYQPHPCPTIAGPSLHQPDLFPTQPGTFPTRDDPCPTMGGPSLHQPDPLPTQAGIFLTRVDPCLTMAGSSLYEPDPFPTQAGTFLTQADSCSSQAGHSHSQAEPSHTPMDVIKLQTGTFKCEHCAKVYKSKSSLKRHMKELEDTPLECALCKKVYTTKCTFKRHLKIHEDPNFFECEHCRKHFRKANSLNVHLKTKHSDEKREHQCPNCGKEFAVAHRMNCHIRYHCRTLRQQRRLGNTGDEAAAVDTHEVGAHDQAAVVEPGTSNVSSGQSSNLGQRWYVCSKCGCKYQLKYNLDRHLERGCTGSPLFSCPDPSCSFQTPLLCLLKRHLFEKKKK